MTHSSDFLEDVKNLGALTASTAYVFDVSDPSDFPGASYATIEQLDVINSSRARIKVECNGKVAYVPRGAPAILKFGGRIRNFKVTPDATVNDKEVQVIAKGRAHNVHTPGLRQR